MTYLFRFACSISAFIALTGCYHATVETGATPSTVVVDKSFASSWIYGLVPPSTVSTSAQCPDGPARVETKLSFVNQLVGFLTLGIYTPMQIKVTCAAPASGTSASTPPPAPTKTSPSGPAVNTEDSAMASPGLAAGTKWVASISQGLFYPANCSAVQGLPESDLLYYSTEDGLNRGGFKRSVAC